MSCNNPFATRATAGEAILNAFARYGHVSELEVVSDLPEETGLSQYQLGKINYVLAHRLGGRAVNLIDDEAKSLWRTHDIPEAVIGEIAGFDGAEAIRRRARWLGENCNKGDWNIGEDDGNEDADRNLTALRDLRIQSREVKSVEWPVQCVVEMANDEDRGEQTREEAISTLAQMRTIESTNALIDIAQNGKDKKYRMAATVALGKWIGDHRNYRWSDDVAEGTAVDCLFKIANSSRDEDERANALFWLQVADKALVKGHVDDLMAISTVKNPWQYMTRATYAGIEALLGRPGVFDGLDKGAVVQKAALNTLHGTSLENVRPLWDMYSDTRYSNDIRKIALDALSRANDPASLGRFIDIIKDKEGPAVTDELKRKAYEGMVMLRDFGKLTQGQNYIIDSTVEDIAAGKITDDGDIIRGVAIDRLGGQYSRKSFEVLSRVMDEDDAINRDRAARGVYELGLAGKRNGSPELQFRITMKLVMAIRASKDPADRERLLGWLLSVRPDDYDVMPQLMRLALGDEDANVRRAAINALSDINDDLTETVLCKVLYCPPLRNE